MNIDNLTDLFEEQPFSVIPNTYKAADGIRYCNDCGQPRQKILKIGDEDRLLPISCKCLKDQQEKRNAELKLLEIEDARRKCFGSRLRDLNSRFQNDEHRNVQVSQLSRGYVNNFTDAHSGEISPITYSDTGLKRGEGLVFFGKYGTGKSYYSAAIANALIEKGYSAAFITFTSMYNDIDSAGLNKASVKKQLLDRYSTVDLLVVDEFAATDEKDNKKILALAYEVINRRHCAYKPYIVSTNLTAEELKSPGSVDLARITQRFLEDCKPVEITGVSRRIEHFPTHNARRTEALLHT